MTNKISQIEDLIKNVIVQCKNRPKHELSPSEKMTPPQCSIGQFVIIGNVVKVKIEQDSFLNIGELKGEDKVFVEWEWKKYLSKAK